jgi:hypothetical protein
VFGNGVDAEKFDTTSSELTTSQDHMYTIFALPGSLHIICVARLMLIDNSAPDEDWEGIAFVSAISLVNVYQNTTNTNTTNSHESVLRLRD